MAKQLSWYGRIKYFFAFCFLILFTFSFFSFYLSLIFCLYVFKKIFRFSSPFHSNLLYNSFIFPHSSSFIVLHNLHICVISVRRRRQLMDRYMKKKIQKKSSHLKDFFYMRTKWKGKICQIQRSKSLQFFIIMHKCSVSETHTQSL